MIGKLRMARAVADDLRQRGLRDHRPHRRPLRGRRARVDARHRPRRRARACATSTPGIPDLLWCEFPTSDREPVETFAEAIRRRFPEARFAFNWSSSFKWFNDPDPITFAELGELGFKFIFITLGGQHAMGHGLSRLLAAMGERQEQGYIELQRAGVGGGRGLPDPQPPLLLRRPLPPPRRQGVRRRAPRPGVRRGALGREGRLTRGGGRPPRRASPGARFARACCTTHCPAEPGNVSSRGNAPPTPDSRRRARWSDAGPLQAEVAIGVELEPTVRAWLDGGHSEPQNPIS